MKTLLKNKRIILGVTGSVAIYKSCELIRLLIKDGASVQVVMTHNATKLINPKLFESLSNNSVYYDEWSKQTAHPMPHISLTRDADYILIVPATASFMAKITHGIADDLLSTLCIASKIPIGIAPAMNVEMWNNPATKRNRKILINDGIEIFEPKRGDQACGEIGFGRLQEPKEILENIKKKNFDKLITGIKHFQNKAVLITAGPTYEAIDPVRGITNKSSGKLGFEIAQALINSGAKVFLISGQVQLDFGPNVHLIKVESADQMLKEVRKILKNNKIEVFFSVAAVADWKPSERIDSKIKKCSQKSLNEIKWVKNKDILAEVGGLDNKIRPFTVGFSAETNEIIKSKNIFFEKLKEKKVDILIGTNGPKTFGNDSAEMLVCHPNKFSKLLKGTKKEIADQLIEIVYREIKKIKNENKN